MAFVDRSQRVTVDEIVSQILDLADRTPGQDRPARIHSVLMDVMTRLAPVLRQEREVCRQTRTCSPVASCDD
uniref:Uncharacterized protein n=1 Tax=Desulfatirhabdium butyrativorans TaxID=340467 RepID=A0A7C4RR49_9BACT